MAVGDKCVDVSELAATDPQRLINMIKEGRLSLISGTSGKDCGTH
jgi:hypothetical protein